MNNDLISREVLKKDFIETINAQGFMTTEEIISKIDNAPTVEEKSYAMGYQDGLEDGLDGIRPQGEWITVKQDTILGNFEVNNKVCDQCNHATKYEYPFCPWCGADMRKGGAE